MERTNTPEQRIDWIAGQVSALGVAVHVLIRMHPQRDQLAQLLHTEIERMHGSLLTTNVSDETLKGLELVRDLFLLKKQDDPGQPSLR